eukprot:gene17080-8597_t
MKQKQVKIHELIPCRTLRICRPVVATCSDSSETQSAPPSQVASKSQVAQLSQASAPMGNIIVPQEPKEKTTALISGILHNKGIGYHYNAVSIPTKDARYDLLCNFWKPGQNFIFPADGSKPRLRYQWLDTFKSLAFPDALDGAFCDNLRVQRSYCHHLELNIDIEVKPKLEAIRNLIEHKRTTVEEIDNEILENCDSHSVEKEIVDRSKLESEVENILCLIANAIVEKSQPEPTTNLQGNLDYSFGSSYSMDNIKVKLPKLSLPSFDGDITQWTSFWESFSSTIQECSSLADIDKFKYLQQAMKGNAAETIAEEDTLVNNATADRNATSAEENIMSQYADLNRTATLKQSHSIHQHNNSLQRLLSNHL